MVDIGGKTVMITGASRGIGAATARIFAQEGANVVLMARSAEAIEALAGEIGAQALAVPGDVARYSDMEKAVSAAILRFGGLEVLINNASVIQPIAHIDEADPESWGRAIDINLKGVFHGLRAALPIMLKAGSGTILTVSSGAAHGPVEGWSHYCASKAGAAMLTRSVHLEYAGRGIRAMGLSPGTVATQMQKEIRASGINPVSQMDWSQHIPPEWPARALLWMCGPDADEFSGSEVSLKDEEIRRRVGVLQ